MCAFTFLFVCTCVHAHFRSCACTHACGPFHVFSHVGVLKPMPSFSCSMINQCHKKLCMPSSHRRRVSPFTYWRNRRHPLIPPRLRAKPRPRRPQYATRWAKVPADVVSFQGVGANCSEYMSWPLDTGKGGGSAGCVQVAESGDEQGWRKLIFTTTDERCGVAPIHAACNATSGHHCDDPSAVPLPCPAGFTCPGGVGCEGTKRPCPAGYYCPGGSLPLVQCTTANTPQGSRCGGAIPPATPCAAGFACPGGDAAPIPCSDGSTWSPAGSAACSPCSELDCQEGTWRRCVASSDTVCEACSMGGCGLGQERGACEAWVDAPCVPCPLPLPSGASWVPPEGCVWECERGMFLNEEAGTCTDCYYPPICDAALPDVYDADGCKRLHGGICPEGQWRGPCEGTHNLLECRPCSNGEGLAVSAGIPHNTDTCGWCGGGGGGRGGGGGGDSLSGAGSDNFSNSSAASCPLRTTPWFLGRSLLSSEFNACLAASSAILFLGSIAAIFAKR